MARGVVEHASETEDDCLCRLGVCDLNSICSFIFSGGVWPVTGGWFLWVRNGNINSIKWKREFEKGERSTYACVCVLWRGEEKLTMSNYINQFS